MTNWKDMGLNNNMNKEDPKVPSQGADTESQATKDDYRLQRLFRLAQKGRQNPENKDGVIFYDKDNKKFKFGIDGKWADINFTTTSTSTSSTSTSTTA